MNYYVAIDILRDLSKREDVLSATSFIEFYRSAAISSKLCSLEITCLYSRKLWEVYLGRGKEVVRHIRPSAELFHAMVQVFCEAGR